MIMVMGNIVGSSGEGRRHYARVQIGTKLAFSKQSSFRPTTAPRASAFLFARQRFEEFFKAAAKHKPLATELAGLQRARLNQLEQLGVSGVDKLPNLAERICLPALRRFRGRHDGTSR